MSFSKFNESVTNHSTLPDKPTLNSTELKTLFDKAGVDIKAYLNEVLTVELDEYTSENDSTLESLKTEINTTIDTKLADLQASIDDLMDTKVDKEDGKGLSTNDFSDTYQTKLVGIEEGAVSISYGTSTPSSSTSGNYYVQYFS